jgi:hypothetical protein
MIIRPAYFRCLRKIGINWNNKPFRTASDSLRSEVTFSVLLGFSLVIELLTIIKMPSIEGYNEVQIARHLFALFLFRTA